MLTQPCYSQLPPPSTHSSCRLHIHTQPHCLQLPITSLCTLSPAVLSSHQAQVWAKPPCPGMNTPSMELQSASSVPSHPTDCFLPSCCLQTAPLGHRLGQSPPPTPTMAPLSTSLPRGSSARTSHLAGYFVLPCRPQGFFIHPGFRRSLGHPLPVHMSCLPLPLTNGRGSLNPTGAHLLPLPSKRRLPDARCPHPSLSPHVTAVQLQGAASIPLQPCRDHPHAQGLLICFGDSGNERFSPQSMGSPASEHSRTLQWLQIRALPRNCPA